MKKRDLLLVAALALASFIAALIGLGLSTKSLITPSDPGGRIAGLYGDGWLASGADVDISHLAPAVNIVEFRFSSWRPPGAGPALLHFTICEKEIGRISLVSDAPITLRLSEFCPNRKILVKADNPFVPSAEDRRSLAAQLVSLTFSSPLGIPIVEPLLLALVGLVIFLCALSLYLALPRVPAVGVLAVCTLGGAILASANDLKFGPQTALALFFLSVFAGMFCASQSKATGAHVRTGIGWPSWVHVLVAASITAMGFALRLYSIDFGLPENLHPDEVPKVNAVMRMVQSGTLNPEYFLHPSLLLYSTYAMNHLLNFFLDGLQFQDTLVLAGRLVSAFAGALSIYLLFLIGRLLFSAPAGLAAGFLLAVFPLHVTCSRYLKEDALLTFLTLVSFYFAVRAVKLNRPKFILYSAFAAGLAASSKYSGILCIAFACGAPWFKSRSFLPQRGWLKYLFFGLLLFPIGFIIASPYSILDASTFIDDFSYEKRHMERGHASAIDAWSQYWMYYFERALAPGASWVVVIITCFMIGLALRLFSFDLLFVVAALLLFYLPAEWIKAKPAPQAERYVMPCLPFMALLCGSFFTWLAASRIRLFALPITAAVLITPFLRSLNLAAELTPDTRQQMRGWIVENIPPGEEILIDWPLYSPSLPVDRFSSRFMDRSEILQQLDPKRLRASGADYLLVSSFFYMRYTQDPNKNVPGRSIVRELFQSFPIVKQLQTEHGPYGFNNPILTLFDLKRVPEGTVKY